MAIYKLIANGSFGPDEIKVISEAYEGALIDLGSSTETIRLRSLFNVTATCERNPKEVMERALNALGVRRAAPHSQSISRPNSALQRPINSARGSG
jgi:hypothetical protein